MNRIYDNNIKALEKISKKSTDYIRAKVESFENKTQTEPRINDKHTFDEKGMFEEIEVDVEESFTQEKIFKVRKGDLELYLSGKRNPNALAEKWTEKFAELPRTSFVIMFGLGDGRFLREVCKKIGKEVRVFVYEPSLKIFIKCLEEVDLTEIIKSHEISFGIDNNISFDEIKEILARNIHMDNLEFLRWYVLPGYFQLYPGESKQFLELVRGWGDKLLTFHGTKVFFANVAMGTLLYNAMYLPDCRMTTQLVDVIPRNLPAIVVAAGPSLNKNISELKKAKGKAFIIAADTAVKPLMKAGIVPDMYTVVDAVKPVELVQYPGAERIPLLTSVISSQAVLAHQTGLKFFFNEGFEFINKPFDDLGIPFDEMSMGGSVATASFALSYMIGLNTIILVGQDLALTGGKSHVDGAFHEKEEALDTTGYMMVPGNVEKEVPTRPDFKKYLDWYDYYIEGCKEHRPQLTVINATEGGAKIKGTEVMNLKDAIEKYCTESVELGERINSVPPAFEGANREKVVEYLRSTEAGFRKIAEDALKQKKLYQKIDKMADTGRMSTKEYEKLLVKIKKLTKTTIKSPLYELVDDTLIDASLILQKELLVEEGSMVEEAKELARKGIIYMDLMNECANLLADVAADSVSNVK